MSARGHKPLLAVWRDAVCESDLDGTTKGVLLALSTFMNARGYAFPSEDTLGAASSRTDTTVRRATEKGEQTGFLSVSRSKGRSSHRYQATLPVTANVVRRSEWATAGGNGEIYVLNGEDDARNPERRSPESAEGAEGGAPCATAALEGAVARALPLDDCICCGRRRPLVDDLNCADCFNPVAPDEVAT